MKREKTYYRSNLRLTGWYVYLKNGAMMKPIGGDYYLIHRTDLAKKSWDSNAQYAHKATELPHELKVELLRTYATRKTLVERANVIPPDMQFHIERDKNYAAMLDVNKL